MKQSFLDIQQSAEQDSDPYRRVKKEVNARISKVTVCREFPGYFRGRRNQTEPSHVRTEGLKFEEAQAVKISG